MSVFGIFKSGWDVEEAAMSHLSTWLPTYLAEIERQKEIGQGKLRKCRQWIRATDFSKWPEDQLPVGLVISPGLVGDPVKDGDGTYRAPWSLGVAVVVSAKDRDSTNKLAKLYAAAVRGAILQHQSLGGFARGIDWVDERYDDIPREDDRTMGAAQAVFRVEVGETIQTLAGLIEPPADVFNVPGSWPSASEVAVTTTRKE